MAITEGTKRASDLISEIRKVCSAVTARSIYELWADGTPTDPDAPALATVADSKLKQDAFMAGRTVLDYQAFSGGLRALAADLDGLAALDITAAAAKLRYYADMYDKSAMRWKAERERIEAERERRRIRAERAGALSQEDILDELDRLKASIAALDAE